MSSLHTHGTPVAVANDCLVILDDGSDHEANQVTFWEGGWCVIDDGETKDVLPRERIQAVITEENDD